MNAGHHDPDHLDLDLPTSAEGFTPAWLTEVLRRSGAISSSSVATVTSSDIGAGSGVFGIVLRLALTYDHPEAGAPRSLVAKLPTAQPANLEVALALRLYEREVGFYRHAAAFVPVRVPRSYLAVADAATGRFLVLLEDMADGTGLQVGDQVRGLTLHEASVTIENLAAMHAAWWQRPELDDLSFLPRLNEPMYLEVVPGIFRGGLPAVEERYADRLPVESLRLARRLEPVFEELTYRCAVEPTTLIHTDTRLDNLFFDVEGGDGFGLIDFQLAIRGRGVSDVSYLLGTSLPVELQRDHAMALLRRYYDRLIALGVEDYGWDQCQREFREHALWYLCSPISMVGTFSMGGDPRGEALTDAFVLRGFNLIVNCDAGAAL